MGPYDFFIAIILCAEAVNIVLGVSNLLKEGVSDE